MMEADKKGDGKIDLEEWKEFIARNPSLIKTVTLAHLTWGSKSCIICLTTDLEVRQCPLTMSFCLTGT